MKEAHRVVPLRSMRAKQFSADIERFYRPGGLTGCITAFTLIKCANLPSSRESEALVILATKTLSYHEISTHYRNQ